MSGTARAVVGPAARVMCAMRAARVMRSPTRVVRPPQFLDSTVQEPVAWDPLAPAGADPTGRLRDSATGPRTHP